MFNSRSGIFYSPIWPVHHHSNLGNLKLVGTNSKYVAEMVLSTSTSSVSFDPATTRWWKLPTFYTNVFYARGNLNGDLKK